MVAMIELVILTLVELHANNLDTATYHLSNFDNAQVKFINCLVKD